MDSEEKLALQDAVDDREMGERERSLADFVEKKWGKVENCYWDKAPNSVATWKRIRDEGILDMEDDLNYFINVKVIKAPGILTSHTKLSFQVVQHNSKLHI